MELLMIVFCEASISPSGPLEALGLLELLFMTATLEQLTLLASKADSLKPPGIAFLLRSSKRA